MSDDNDMESVSINMPESKKGFGCPKKGCNEGPFETKHELDQHLSSHGYESGSTMQEPRDGKQL